MDSQVYIIIVTYNGMQWLDKCLSNCEDYNIIVVDNNSTDNTVSFIKENYSKVKLIEQKKNLGFGKANNIGISYAMKQDVDYVFLLNQDAYLQLDTIKKLTKVHQTNLNFGILSPIHLNGNGGKLDRNFSHYLGYDNNDTFYFDAINNDLKTVYEVPFVNAAAWLLPRKTLENIGGFDPMFFHYGEDDNYCQRVLFHKMKIGVVASSFICHDRVFKIVSGSHKPFSNSYFELKERALKYKWADVNNDFSKKINSHKKSLLKRIIKSKLKFNFKLASNYNKEMKLIKKIELEIINSKSINSKLGSHYI